MCKKICLNACHLPGNSDVETLIRTLEKDAQYWENLLSVSGGCLELSKCFYYVLAWTFTDKGDPIPMTTAELDSLAAPIQLCEFGKTTSTSIQMKSVDEAHKTLGVWKTMIGNNKVHLQHLKHRSNNMAAIVATSGMYPHQADVALRMIYTTSMLYSLPAVNVTKKDLNRIQFKAFESFVPALGYNKGMPQAVLFGPSDYGGASLPHLYTESNIQKLDLLVMHIRANTELGHLFRINLNYIQLSLGFGTPFFEHQRPIPYMSNWFTEVRDFLISIKGKLCISDTYTPQLERYHDQYIMEAFSTLNPPLSKNQVNYINHWREFFQVQVLSDLSNAQGDSILSIYLTYPSDKLLHELRPDRQTTLHWPYQQCPTSTTTFALWVSCIRKCFSNRSGNKLRQQLGSWIVSPQQSLSKWTAYYESITKQLYICNNGSIVCYDIITRSTSCTTVFDTRFQTTVAELPPTCFPVDIHISDSLVTARHNKIKMIIPPTSLKAIHTIDDAIQQAPKWQFHLLRNYRIHDIDYLISCIQHNDTPLLCVTDGGCRDGIGSFGVAMGTPTYELFSIEGPAPGHVELMTSFRSEGYGMLAGLNFLCLFIEVYKIHIPPHRIIQMHCDNLALVNWITRLGVDKITPRMYLKSETDVIMQIVASIHQLSHIGITLQILHVKGHQDKDNVIPYSELSRPAQLNVDADTYATNFLDHGASIPYIELPANPVNFYLSEAIITRSTKYEVRKASCSPDLRTYLIKRLQWHSNTPDLVWWEVHGSSMRLLHPNDRRRIRKFIFRWLPTSLRLQYINPDISSKCPSCGTVDETHVHILKCSCTTRAHIKTEWCTNLKKFLTTNDHTPAIPGQILYDKVVSSCTHIAPTPMPESLSPLVQSAYIDQEKIGWDQLLCGRLAYKWGTIIANHLYEQKVSPKEMSALMWGRKFTKLMFELILKLWEQRNKDGHVISSQNDSQLTRIRLLANILAMQDSNPDIPYEERVFVFRSIETLESYSLINLQAWYRMAKNIIHNNAKRTKPNPTPRLSRRPSRKTKANKKSTGVVHR